MSAPSVYMLLLEDSELDADLVSLHLSKDGLEHTVERVVDRDSFVAAVQRGGFDLILSDYQLPQFDAAAALQLAQQHAPDTPFIVISGVVGEERVVEMMKRGAVDYVLKQRIQRLPMVVRRALNEARLRHDQRRAEQRQRLLAAELNHRVKNTLATVLSLVQRSAHRATSVRDFETSIVGRLRAMADTHALLFEVEWSTVGLRPLIELALRPFDPGGRVGGGMGPAVMLSPEESLTLGLVLHELATNAAKYGALAAEHGTVRLDWSVERRAARSWLRLGWKEHDGPHVVHPSDMGFGTTLIRRGIEYDLDGSSELNFEQDGLRCTICFPLRVAAGGEDSVRAVGAAE